MFSTDVKITNGFAKVGNKPGLGIEINYDELSNSSVGSVSVKSGPSPYGRRQGAGLYEVPPLKDEINEARTK